MLTTCRLSDNAQRALSAEFGEDAIGAEIEFKELPYFMVTRSRTNWNFETQGDINAILMLDITDRGIMVDPEREGEPARKTLIPWSNIISLSIVRGADDSSPTKEEGTALS